MELRPYQLEAIEALYAYLREHDDNPCVVLPTASGKTPCLATICRDAVLKWEGRVIVLAHVKELLEQAADKLQAICPDVMVGIFSAGLGRKDTLAPVIVAGIQSAYKRANELGHFDLAICDESHLVPAEGEGMYRTLLADLKAINPAIRIIGLTATPFRMSTGPICTPENILNKVCYEIGVKDLIEQGFICPLRSKAGKQKADTKDLHIRGGEFIPDEVQALMNTDTLVEAACKEIIDQSQDRRAVLVFTSGIEHGRHVAATLVAMGQRAETVFGDTLPFERDRILTDFKEGKLKYLVNVNVLTTGFDAPICDCVAILRPTMSPGLFYQMVGRGFRLHPGKEFCRILDHGGNTMRHGPVDMVGFAAPVESDEEAKPVVKECPQCQALIAAGFLTCPECGFSFPVREIKKKEHEAQATEQDILSGQATTAEYEVKSVQYSVHYKKNAPPDAPRTMRVEYECGWHKFQSEWICLEHDGFAYEKAARWWRRRSFAPIPKTIEDAVRLAEAGALAETTKITVRTVPGERFDSIVGHILGPKPDWDPAPIAPREPGADEGEPAFTFVPIDQIPEDDLPF